VEEWIVRFAGWLGSNALVFFLVATTVACAMASLVWYLLVREAPRLGRWSASRRPRPHVRRHAAAAVSLKLATQ
jgi:hypothetical protein